MGANTKEIFISWSGNQTKKYAQFLENVLKVLFDREAEVFFSESIEDGKVWLSKINEALSSAKIGLILLTRENLQNPWLNFEAGALFKANEKDATVIPIYIDLPESKTDKHPLHYFHSKYNFDWESIEKLINKIHDDLKWDFRDFGARETIKKELEILISKHQRPDPIEEYLYLQSIPIYHNKGSFMAEMSDNIFWTIRKKVIENTRGTLILAGQSLEDAFGDNDSISITETLKNAVLKQQINAIKILITDPMLFSDIRNINSLEMSPLSRVSLTMDTLINEIFPLCQDKECKVKVYFIPLLEIDHAAISGQYMAFRSTKLWTRYGNFKGSFCIYRNTSAQYSEYKAHKQYLEKIMENSTRIDLEIDIYGTPDDNETMRKHKLWRRAIKEANYTHVQLYKLYHAQIVNYVADDWMKEPSIYDSFIPSEDIREYDDLFNPENLLNDDTQRLLLPYVRETKKLFENVINKYDSSKVQIGVKNLQRSGVMIYPSLDLGFPNNVQRLAGGFATGMLVMWKCGTPIVPVDATVNVCSSSVFKLDRFNTNFTDSEFKEYIDNIMLKATLGKGYSFSFDSGNHFLMVAQDSQTKEFYLVLHSSAKEFKDSYMGLYPVEGNWYSNCIKTSPTPYAPHRYIRYIKDEDAKYFIENAHRLEKYNEQIHRWFAETVNEKSYISDNQFRRYTYHHYYMPTDSSIAIGTYVELPGTVVPIFSNVGKNIYMFKISKKNWKVRIKGENRCLVPHGWGQAIDGVKSISVNNEEHYIKIDDMEYAIESKVRIRGNTKKHVRNFEDGEEFLRIGSRMVKGEIVQTLIPIYLYCGTKKGKVNEPL